MLKSSFRLLGSLFLLAAVCLATTSAFGQTSTFLKIGDIKGDVRDFQDLPDSSRVTSFSGAALLEIDLVTGSGGKCPVVDPIVVTKAFDRASIHHQFALLSGQQFGEAKLIVASSDGGKGNKLVPLLIYTLENAVIVSHSYVEGGGGLEETMELAFARLEVEHRPLDKTDGSINPVIKTYNLSTCSTS